MKSNIKGFTLIELVIVILVIGVLAAIAVPTFFDLTSTAATNARTGSLNGVHAGWAIALGRHSGSPTVQQIADQTRNATAVASGVYYVVNGTTYIVNTYTDVDGATTTTATTDTVAYLSGGDRTL